MPGGYQARVAERGLNLSGGQRQRLALALFLKDPPILILDEGTSALDTVSERKIQRAVEAARRDRTVILVAHRLSTLRHADRVAVFEAGRVVEVGGYHELIGRGGAFAEFVALAPATRTAIPPPVCVLDGRSEAVKKPLPPAPSPKRRGGARKRVPSLLPLSASGRGAGGRGFFTSAQSRGLKPKAPARDSIPSLALWAGRAILVARGFPETQHLIAGLLFEHRRLTLLRLRDICTVRAVSGRPCLSFVSTRAPFAVNSCAS